MKYCPYCGTVLVDGAISFCMECGKKLPVKDAERGRSQTNDNEGVHQETAESCMESKEKKITAKHSQKPSQRKSVIRAKEQPVQKTQRPPELPEEEEQPIKPAMEPEQISKTDPEDDYDGYYEDVLPVDEGRFNEGMDREMIKKVLVIIGAVLLIVALCVGMMYVL